MKFVPVESIPERKRRHTDLMERIDEFAHSNAMIIKVDFTSDEYVNSSSCAGSFSRAVKRSGYAMDVHVVNGEVYIRKMR